MKQFVYTVILATVLSCGKNPESYISHISGYWEIEKVKLANGTEREYKISQTIDYFFVSDSLTGFRKKLQPNFQGTYVGSKDSEPFQLKIESNTLQIHYKTNLDTWTETIEFANENELQLKNEANNLYIYKRYTPININE